jgi:thiamine biosynthesis lipoprotein
MGTIFRIVLYAEDESLARGAGGEAFERIAELDARLSDYRADSELNRLVNAAGGAPVPVSDDLFRALAVAQAFAIRTEGAFDVTAGALTRLWRRARRLNTLPDSGELQAALALSGHRLMHLDAEARTVRLERAGLRLDLGGIGKGYAADQALARLRQAGVVRALVAAGGDVAAADPPPDRDGWEVAVAGWSGGPLTLVRAAVSTSGDREQWLEVNGVRYSHILDPRTGQAVTRPRQVSAMAGDATTSDMLATAASVMSDEDALRLADETAGAAVLIGTIDAGHGVSWLKSGRWRP